MQEKRRYYNFFKEDGRSFMMAFDHAGVFQYFPDPESKIKAAIKGGIDGILVNSGVLANYGHLLGDVGVIVRADHASSALYDAGDNYTGDDWRLYQNAKTAASLGADGMMCFALPGATSVEFDRRSYENVSTIVRECNEYGLISAAEVMARGIVKNHTGTIDDLAHGCRLACERGADFIKTSYMGTPEEYHEKVVKNCYRPICVLGGSSMPECDTLQMVRDSLDAGCKGVVMGRNVFEHEDVTRFAAAVAKLIHEDCSVDVAMKELH